MSALLRWGRSAYETPDDLAREQRDAHELGFTMRAAPRADILPDGRADVLVVTSKANVDARALDSVRPQLVITTTSGFEHLDLVACAERGIAACRCPLARRDAVVEHTIYALIRLLRRLPAQEAPAYDGRWGRADLPALAPRSLSGTPIAVVGLGVIGTRVATVLTALGAQVLGVDPSPSDPTMRAVPLPDALAQAHAVTLHTSSTPSARGLLDAEALAGLRPGCVVVNTARGDLMDPIAAAGLVASGHLGGLACDVFPEEPWPHLAAHAGEQVLLTPHASGYTVGLGERVAAEVRGALTAWIAGDPLPWRLV